MMKTMIDLDAMQGAIGDPALARFFTRRFVDAAERFLNAMIGNEAARAG